MVRHHLSRDLIAAGAAFIAELDELGFEAQGAFWVREHELDLWRYGLVTVLEDSADANDPYALLLEIFPRGEAPGGMTLHDVRLMDTSDPLFRAVTQATAHARPDAPAAFADLLASGRRYDGLVYRAEPGQRTPSRPEEIADTVGRRLRARSAAAPAE